MLKIIDSFLNSITMYRVVLYGLMAITAISLLLGLTGHIYYDFTQQITSLSVLLVACLVTNWVFAKFFKVPINIESTPITAFILFFLLIPVSGIDDVYVAIFAAAIAMTSKYLFIWNQKHIFNPAAFAVFVLGILGNGSVIWWVGSDILLPFVLIVGLLVVRKIRRFLLFFSFVAASLVAASIFSIVKDLPLLTTLFEMFTSWPLMFLGTIMLTEPLTLPPTKKLQMIYGIVVGIFLVVPFQVGPIYSTPELALLLGNIFAFVVSPKVKLTLYLESKKEVAEHTYEFLFKHATPFSFNPGQYLEWTVPPKNADSRGNRRYFTIASSPTEELLRLVVRIEKNASTYKQKLLALKPTEKIIASQLSGDFVLSDNKDEKLVFIAGGIGFTPFLSMIKYLMDKKEKRDITVFYANKTKSEIAYKSVLEEAKKQIGLKTVYVLTSKDTTPPDWTGKVGRIDQQMIEDEVSDYKNRKYYLSGPNAMVDAYKNLLLQMGVSRSTIITDYFPGF